jgi:hypothetical protein
MRSGSQILTFLDEYFYLDARPLPFRELAREPICIPSFRDEATKPELARLPFSELQLGSIT